MLSDIDRQSVVSLADSTADGVYEDVFEATVTALAEETDLAKRRLLRDRLLDLTACYVSVAARAAVEVTEALIRRQRESQQVLANQLERYDRRERRADGDDAA